MEKLKLDLDDLQVESFDTTPDQLAQEKGTIYGYYTYEEGTCAGPSCHICPTQLACTGQYTCGGATCDQTCPNTCANTCPATCAYTCQGTTCEGGYTCGFTCSETCGPSCYDTCPIQCPPNP